MSNQNNNTYNDCINEFHARYDNRGVAANAAKEIRSQEPNAYLVARNNKSQVSDKYRNGEYNSQRYMTTGDFLKYYNSRKTASGTTVTVPHTPSPVTREFKKPQRQAAPAVMQESNTPKNTTVTPPARPVRKYDPQADTIVMPAQKSKSKVKGRISSFVAKWFPAEAKTEKTAAKKRNLPVAMVGLLLSASIAMTIIVSTSVMANNAQTELSELKYDVKTLQSESDVLEEELVKKDNLEDIYEYATLQLGMIRKDYVSSVYLNSGTDDTAEGDGETERDMSALLSAMFGN